MSPNLVGGRPSPLLVEPDYTPEQALAIVVAVTPVGWAVTMDGNLAAAPAMLEHLAKLGYRLERAEATAPLLAALREISESYDEWSRRSHHQADPMIPERLWRALVAGAALVPAEPPEAQRCDCRGAGSYYRAEHAFGCPMFASPAEPPEAP